MTYKSKTPTSFLGRSCAHYGDGYGIPCPHFGDALSLFWGRFNGFLASPCAHFGDILNNHTPNNLFRCTGREHTGRQTCVQRSPTFGLEIQPQTGAFVGVFFGGGGAVGGYAFALCGQGSLQKEHELPTIPEQVPTPTWKESADKEVFPIQTLRTGKDQYPNHLHDRTSRAEEEDQQLDEKFTDFFGHNSHHFRLSGMLQ
jgi:hypothetical protein